MTVLIDDANWGCLLRGCLIGIYRVETEEMEVGEVPVEYFQEPKFSRHDYLWVIADIVKGLLDKLSVDSKERVTICRGYVLREARERFVHQGYNCEPRKITGPFQEKLESQAIDYVNELGVGIDVSRLEQYGSLFFICLEWLKGGDLDAYALPEREIHAKTGWESYSIWAYNTLEMAKALARQRRIEGRKQRSKEER